MYKISMLHSYLDGTKADESEVLSLNVNFNLKKIRGKHSQIWLKTTINGQRVSIYTKMLIEPKYWSKATNGHKGERAIIDSDFGKIQNSNNRKINMNLQKILDYCHDYVSLVTQEDLEGHTALIHSKDNFIDFIKSKLEGRKASFERNLLAFIEDYIERKKNMINHNTMRTLSSGTIYNHQNALKRLLTFCAETHKNMSWDLFNDRFEEDFTSWMVKKGYSANTIPAQFSIFKVWLSEAENENFLRDKSFHKFRTKGKDVENIYLTEEEILKIYNIDFSSENVKSLLNPREKIEQTRDLFVLACCTGLRYSDYKDLSNAQIDNDILKVYTRKTGQLVYIPILPIVREILDKYNGRLPTAVYKTNSLRQLRFCAKLAGIDSPTTITTIKGGKAVTRTAPKYEFVMNHTARRSFATNLYKRGVPTLSIMAITGHTTEANFLKYIKVSKAEHAEIVRAHFVNK